MAKNRTQSAPPKPRMVYQTAETREHILAVAERLFTKTGLFETQMMDVAKAADVSRTTLYRYFQDKLDLSIAILERVVDDMETRARQEDLQLEGCGIERLDGYLRRRWCSAKFRMHRRFFAEFDTFFSGPRLPVAFKGRLEEALRKHSLDHLRAIICDGIQDGSIRPDIDADLAAVTVLNAVRGLFQRVLLRGKVLVEVQRGQLSKITDEHIRFLLDGLRPPGRS